MSRDDTIVGRGHRSLKGVRIDAVLWGLFFVWMGTILLWQDMPKGLGSVGIGVLVLGGAVVRWAMGASVSVYWLVIGLVFIMAGIGGFLARALRRYGNAVTSWAGRFHEGRPAHTSGY